LALVLHHLDDSRAHRVLWLMEELGLDYEIRPHKKTRSRFAPPSLEAAHPLGKAPVLQSDDLTLIESGAIVDHLIRRHGAGRLAPPLDDREYDLYQQWLHYAEASAMACLVHINWLRLLDIPDGPGRRRLEAETTRHLRFVEAALADRTWLLRHGFSAADIQMSYFGEVAAFAGRLAPYPAIRAWIERFQARPAYQSAVRAGGAHRYAGVLESRQAP
jgi:glutathione S-transferase